jgi:hypothetical protein
VRAGALFLSVVAVVALTGVARGDDAECERWRESAPADTFVGHNELMRSQGVATDGTSWFFSWLGGVEKTDDSYVTQAANGWPADIAVNHPLDPGTHLFNTHIGDIDSYNGKIYAPYEDGNEGPFNDPEYQHPYIAVYDAKTLLYTGEHYELPLELHFAGAPWIAINAKKQLAYTAEWDMHHDRINVFDLKFRFKRFIDLHYQPELGANFHLDRIQGMKVYKGALYGTRDDNEKSIFKVDLDTGEVTKLFSVGPVPDDKHKVEIEGLAFRPTEDGLMHVLTILDFDTKSPEALSRTRVTFRHFSKEDCDD